MNGASCRIIVDRGLAKSEARNRPEVMDLCPEDGDFHEKFRMNHFNEETGQVLSAAWLSLNFLSINGAWRFYSCSVIILVLSDLEAVKSLLCKPFQVEWDKKATHFSFTRAPSSLRSLV